MPPGVRRFALTAHVVASVGWLGAVVGFLALAVAGLAGDDVDRVRGAYVAMQVVTAYVIVPLAFASLLTGLIQALGTSWGLFRHYWVLVKFVITTVATLVLLGQLGPIRHLADLAAGTALGATELRAERLSLVVHASGGIVLLVVTTVLSIYKPRGLTRRGRNALRRP